MPLADVDAQLLVIQGVGDVDPETGDPVQPMAIGSTGLIARNITRLWEKYADKALISTTLRDLYVQREAVDIVIGRLEAMVDFTIGNGGNDGFTVKLSQRLTTRREQRAAIAKELERIEGSQGAFHAPLVAPLLTTEPITPPLPGDRSSPYTWGPDANDPRYRGSPYWRRNATR